MSKQKIYLDLCTQFYELNRPKPPEGAYPFYKSYASEAKGLILEPMCGSGRFLLPLLKDGYKVEGLDLSEHMLSCLREKAKNMGLEPNIWQSLAEEIPEGKSYSLIFIPGISFCFINDTNEIRNTLKSFYKHLDDDGVFVFEIGTKDCIPPLGVWNGATHTRPDGKMLLRYTCISLDKDICSCVCKFELVDDNKVVQTEVEEYRFKVYEHQQLLNLLDEACFKNVKVMKAFDRNSKPEKGDKTIVYECRK